MVKPLNCKFSFFEVVSSSLALFKQMFLISYFSVFLFLSLCIALSSIIFLASFVLSTKADDVEKLSAYECGFNPFEDSRGEFDIRFYIVAILFLIFDLEISFLFPFAVSIDGGESIPFYSMFYFLFILTVGFFYEWKKGALDWD